jgi:hypothetical protein
VGRAPKRPVADHGDPHAGSSAGKEGRSVEQDADPLLDRKTTDIEDPERFSASRPGFILPALPVVHHGVI